MIKNAILLPIKAIATTRMDPRTFCMVRGENFAEPNNAPDIPPAITAISNEIYGSKSISLYCNRAVRPAMEFAQTNIAPQAAASFSVPRPRRITSGMR